MVDPLSLTVDACLAAVADAGLTLDDIDGLSTYPGMAGMGMSEGGVTAVEEALRLRPTWHNGGGELPGPGGSVIAAMLAVASGLCRHVLCFRTVWESTYATLRLGSLGSGRVSGPLIEWRAPFGAMSAANWIGMNANQYLHRYGASREMLGWIALNGRTNAARNPAAIYRDPMTMDDYLSARPITSPFGLYDCDVPCDASIAVVVSDASVAADLPKRAVRIEAVGTQITERVSWDQGTITHEPQVLGQSAHLWTRTSMRPEDVDLALLYDGFTFNAVSWLEALGFCGIGEATDWLDKGRRIALDGELPVNPHGGQLSEGRTHGFGFIYEAMTQLRHEAGDRQVANAQTAVVTSGGGTPSGRAALRTRRGLIAPCAALHQRADRGADAAVDEDVDAGHEARLVGHEERHDRSQLFGPAGTAQRGDVFQHLHHRLLLESRAGPSACRSNPARPNRSERPAARAARLRAGRGAALRASPRRTPSRDTRAPSPSGGIGIEEVVRERCVDRRVGGRVRLLRVQVRGHRCEAHDRGAAVARVGVHRRAAR